MKTTSFKRLLAMLMATLLMISMVTSALSVELQWDKAAYDTAVTDLSSQTTENTIEATSEGFAFSVAGQLPAQAKLDVSTWDAETTAYIRTDILGLPELEEGMTEHAFDITILSGTQEWQPNESVTVDITGLDVDENSEVTVYHIPDNAAPAVATYSLERTSTAAYEVVNDVTVGEGKITFLADGFSTYYVVAGTSNDGNNQYDTSIVEMSGSHNTYYVEPGTVIEFTGGTLSGNGSEYIKLSGTTVIVGKDAPTDESETATFTASYNSRSYNYIFIVSDRNSIITDAIAAYPVYLSIKTSDGTVLNPIAGNSLPSEPGRSDGNYSRLNSNYSTASWSTAFANSATNIIDSKILNKMISSIDGTSTVGLYDATGQQCKTYLVNANGESSINWSEMLETAIDERAYPNGETTRLTNNQATRANYVVIPYVIKLMAENGIGWHIDCIAVPATRITLSYNINLNDYIVNKTLVLPDAITAPNSISTPAGNISGLTNATVEATLNGRPYTLTFKGWSTDPNATTPQYTVGQTVNVTKDTVLYAVWSGRATAGTLEIKKNVVTTDDTYTAPVDAEFTFTLTFAGNGTLNYTVSKNNVQVSTDVIRSGGILKLKAGETATIANVPEGAYTVTETEASGYTMTSTGTNGTIVGNQTSTAVFTNTYIKPAAPLTISKTVKNEDNSARENDTTEFTFKVSVAGQEDRKITVKAGESTVVGEFNIGTEYTVEEINIPVGYTVEGNAKIEGNIDSNGSTAAFTNVYKVRDLTITKAITNKDDNTKDDEFTFDVTYGNTTVTIEGEDSVTIEDIPINTTYTVTEKNLPTGYTMSGATVNGNTATVENNSFTSTIGEANAVVVTNDYTTKSLTITKKIMDANGDVVTDANTADDVFTFDVTLPAGTYTMGGGKFVSTGAAQEITITGQNSIVISGIPTGADYTVTEKQLPIGYEFYQIKDVDADSETVTGKLNGDTPLEYTNKYNTGSLTVEKILSGVGADTTDEFEFTIELTNAPAGTYGELPFTAKAGAENVVTATTTLKGGESKELTNIPVGVTYAVTEETHVDYITTKTGDTGTISATASVAQFTNTFKSGTLTIIKTGLENGDSAIFLIKKGDAEYQKVVVTGDGDKNDSVTIKLPKGSYNVTETDWSWRYNGSIKPEEQNFTIAGGDSHTVNCANTLSDKYLNDEGIEVNNFN